MAEKPRARILNVDDDDAGRYVITKILTRAGYDVLEAATGRDALRLAGERPDLILLDVNLPDIHGLEVCNRIKADPRTASIPVVHLSATHVGSADRVVGLEGGADGYLVQPIDPQELVATVRAFLRLKDAEEALRVRTQQLEAVRAVTTEITRELDLPTLLELINRRAGELVGANSGTVRLWDEQAQLLIPVAWHGLGEWVKDQCRRLGEGVAGIVAQRREGMVVNDYRTSPYANPATLEHSKITAILGEPLIYRDRLLGALTVDKHGLGSYFTEGEHELFRLFTAQAAIAIENARLYEELRMAARQLEVRVEDRTRDLREAMRRAEEASRAKSDFLANMSHELRTPLNPVIGFAEILLTQTAGPLNEKQARYLQHIHQGGKHLLEIINDILDLIKVEARKLKLTPEELSVAVTLEDSLVLARSLADKKCQTVEADIKPDLPPLRADPVRFKQILFNLLSNAVKFTAPGGSVRVTARRIYNFQFPIADLKVGDTGPQSQISNQKSEMRDFLEIAVTDTGAGIRPEDLAKLFQEFVQLETTRAQKHEGTGLGLALTRRLVELHGGRIWAESEGEGKGATFTVRLPFEGPGTRET